MMKAIYGGIVKTDESMSRVMNGSNRSHLGSKLVVVLLELGSKSEKLT